VLIVGSRSELYRATGTDVPQEARSQRNVAGEILAVRNGLSWCREHGVRHVSIYYDYEGLEAWVTGRWQARNPFTAAYALCVRESGVVVRWQKVRAHSGRSRNEQVDRLARQAATAALSGLPGRDRPAASPSRGKRLSSDPGTAAIPSPEE
jgi:ribonuclease HI